MKANFMKGFTLDEILLIHILPNLLQLQNLEKSSSFLQLEINVILSTFPNCKATILLDVFISHHLDKV